MDSLLRVSRSLTHAPRALYCAVPLTPRLARSAGGSLPVCVCVCVPPARYLRQRGGAGEGGGTRSLFQPRRMLDGVTFMTRVESATPLPLSATPPTISLLLSATPPAISLLAVHGISVALFPQSSVGL